MPNRLGGRDTNPILEALRDAFPAPMSAARAEDLETGPAISTAKDAWACHYCPLGAMAIAIDPEIGNGARYRRFPSHLDGSNAFIKYAGFDPNGPSPSPAVPEGWPYGFWRLRDDVYWEARAVTENADLQPDSEIETAWEALGRLMVKLGFEAGEGAEWEAERCPCHTCSDIGPEG